MLKIILVRHGETESNKKGAYLGWTDVQLNNNGLRRAHLARQKLKETKVDMIFCSPLKRATETAQIINKNYNKEIIFDDALKEINFGLWDNLTYDEIREKHEEKHKEWLEGSLNFIFPQGESAQEAFERHEDFINKLTEEVKEGTVLLVTHGGFIRNAIAILLGMKAEDAWHFKVDNGSISKIEVSDEYGVLTVLNT